MKDLIYLLKNIVCINLNAQGVLKGVGFSAGTG